MRIYYYKSYNELTLILSDNMDPFHIIIIDFIMNLLFARNLYSNKISDIILILINKLTKHVIYVTTIKKLKNKESC